MSVMTGASISHVTAGSGTAPAALSCATAAPMMQPLAPSNRFVGQSFNTYVAAPAQNAPRMSAQPVNSANFPTYLPSMQSNIQGASDIYRRLKNVEIPTFTGDKRMYEAWKAAFDVCVDQQLLSQELKLLQLRQYMSGEAQRCIETLGFSATAYTAARNRLERKFGGSRRQIAGHLAERDQFRPITSNKPNELE